MRTIFRLYLELGSLNLLLAELRKRWIVTKVRLHKDARRVGGIPFTRGPLAHLLRNRFYIGEVAFKGEILKGEQSPILDRALFEAVQARLSEQATSHKALRLKSEALLAGRIFDDRGNRMSPTFARRRGIKYRYYLSTALLHGAPERAGSVRRVPAAEIESLVLIGLRDHLKLSEPLDDPGLVNKHVARVEVQTERLLVQLAWADESDRDSANLDTLYIAWQKAPPTRRREILLPESTSPESTRPIRAETRATLVASIARGRRWLNELIADARASAEGIARREGCSTRKVNMTMSLAFLAPDLVNAAIDGRLPHGMGVTRLTDLPAEWSEQHKVLGLPAV